MRVSCDLSRTRTYNHVSYHPLRHRLLLAFYARRGEDIEDTNLEFKYLHFEFKYLLLKVNR